MNKLINNTKNKIFFISTKKIKHCIYPSKYCDFTQFGLDKNHPHAGLDRGFFIEDLSGYIHINSSNWDQKPGVLFSSLLEFKALRNHYTGKENWKKSKFAIRTVEYMKKNEQSHDPRSLKKNFKNYKDFLKKREKQIDKLFNSVMRKGIYPVDFDLASNKYKKLISDKIKIIKGKKIFVDNISVVLTNNGEFFFNNHGHHRLSIAKILDLKVVPVKIVVAKSEKILNNFYETY